MSKYIYVAGPISSRPGVNTANALEVATELLDAGLFPFCPHLTFYWHAFHPHQYEAWMQFDFAWIRRCDALLRISGASPGADREVVLAQSIGLPVFHTVSEVIAWART